MPSILLAVDIGTTGLKAALFDGTSGTVLASAVQTYPTRYTADGGAEQNTADWTAACARACEQLAACAPSHMNQIAAVGVGGMMNGAVLVDNNGDALRPAILHADTRSAAQCERLTAQFGRDALFRATANRPDPHLSLPKVLWLQDNEPELLKQTACVVQAKDFLRGKLTGQFAVTDPSDASLTGAWDVQNAAWRTDIWQELGLPARLLPRVLPSTKVAGRVTREAANVFHIKQGVPVVCGGGDGACATAGAGVPIGGAYLYLGGTAWVGMRSRAIVDDNRLSAYACLDDTVTVFGTCQSAGSSVDWLTENVFGPGPTLAERDAQAALVAPGADGLTFLPYLQGERSPLWDASARGVFFGLTSAHGQAHLLWAVREGVAFALASILDVFADNNCALETLRVLGGGTQSGLWNTILPAVLARTLLPVTDGGTATVRGAAMAAGVGVGLFPDWNAALSLVQTGPPSVPDQQLTDAYIPLRRFYSSLYPTLKERFAALVQQGTLLP